MQDTFKNKFHIKINQKWWKCFIFTLRVSLSSTTSQFFHFGQFSKRMREPNFLSFVFFVWLVGREYWEWLAHLTWVNLTSHFQLFFTVWLLRKKKRNAKSEDTHHTTTDFPLFYQVVKHHCPNFWNWVSQILFISLRKQNPIKKCGVGRKKEWGEGGFDLII